MKKIIILSFVFFLFAVPVLAEQPISFSDSDLQRYKRKGDAVVEPQQAESQGQADTQPQTAVPQEEGAQETPQEEPAPAGGEEQPPSR